MTTTTTTLPILINRKQASELTGLSERYFDFLRKRGVLRTYRTDGGLHRFYRDEVVAHVLHNFKSNTSKS